MFKLERPSQSPSYWTCSPTPDKISNLEGDSSQSPSYWTCSPTELLNGGCETLKRRSPHHIGHALLLTRQCDDLFISRRSPHHIGHALLREVIFNPETITCRSPHHIGHALLLRMVITKQLSHCRSPHHIGHALLRRPKKFLTKHEVAVPIILDMLSYSKSLLAWNLAIRRSPHHIGHALLPYSTKRSWIKRVSQSPSYWTCSPTNIKFTVDQDYVVAVPIILDMLSYIQKIKT